jgi:hypothetical protein
MENRHDSSNNNDNKNNKNQKKKKENDNNFIDINANTAKSITNLWQQYSPMAWSEMYNECVKYAARMIEIYQEYAKSSERMAKKKQ